MRGGDASFRTALFQTLSIVTTTGYASVDFEQWTDQAKVILLALMFIGGCAGSAAGGPKVLRHVLVGRYTLTELRRTLHPRGVLPVKLGGKVVSEEIMRTVLVFFLFYILMFAVCAAIVIGFGADIVTGLTATRDPRQYRTGARPSRADGELRTSASGEQGCADRGDVDRASGSAHSPRSAPLGSVAVRTLARISRGVASVDGSNAFLYIELPP